MYKHKKRKGRSKLLFHEPSRINILIRNTREEKNKKKGRECIYYRIYQCGLIMKMMKEREGGREIL